MSSPTSASASPRLARLHRAVDGQRHRRGLARDIAGQHQGGAELAQRAGEGEHEPAMSPLRASGSVTSSAVRQLRPAQRISRALEIAVHRLDGGARGADQQRQRHHGGGHHRGVPGESNAPARGGVDRRAQEAAASEQHDQVVARHGGREDERKRDQQVHQPASPESPPRQDIGERDAEQRIEEGGRGRDLDGQPERGGGLGAHKFQRWHRRGRRMRVISMPPLGRPWRGGLRRVSARDSAGGRSVLSDHSWEHVPRANPHS